MEGHVSDRTEKLDPASNAEQQDRHFATRPYLQQGVSVFKTSRNHDNREEIHPLTDKNAATGPLKVDNESICGDSVFSNDLTSLSDQRRLLSNNYQMASRDRQQKTTSRRVFLGVCHAANMVVPIDVDKNVTSMHTSSLAKVARVLKK